MFTIFSFARILNMQNIVLLHMVKARNDSKIKTEMVWRLDKIDT